MSADPGSADPGPVVVAIDGPAGSGKSSVSRAAAEELGFGFLDTGAAYRALTWVALERGIDVLDAAEVLRALDDFPYHVVPGSGGERVAVGDADVTDAIRAPRVTAAVSAVARVPEVRVALTEVFRGQIRSSPAAGIVVEGRDITTVVVPDARVRILLTAEEAVRIARRAAESAPGEASADALRRRDAADARVVDFLTAAEGVDTIDSTHLDFGQTVAAVVALVRERIG